MGNVWRDATAKALREVLSEYGEVVRVTMKGHYAFAEFAEVKQAAEAIKGVNGKNKGGRQMYLEPSSAPNNRQKKPVQTPDTKQTGEQIPEEKKKEAAIAKKFDPSTEARDWGALDLGAMLEKHGPKDVEAMEQVVEYEFREKVRKQEEVKLRLTEDIEFSMTIFNKLNKGFTNVQKVNCFMNVCL